MRLCFFLVDVFVSGIFDYVVCVFMKEKSDSSGESDTEETDANTRNNRKSRVKKPLQKKSKTGGSRHRKKRSRSDSFDDDFEEDNQSDSPAKKRRKQNPGEKVHKWLVLPLFFCLPGSLLCFFLSLFAAVQSGMFDTRVAAVQSGRQTQSATHKKTKWIV